MKRKIEFPPISALISLFWPAVLAWPSNAQEQPQMIVRPALAPDSLAKKLASHAVDTARVRRNWAKLRKGQTEAEVRLLLGLPAMVHIDDINGWRVWWYGPRSVAFNSVSKRLSHWDKMLDH